VELNWSTFLLEILNFLVLVWILKRFLYKPVLAVIARRREGIDRQLADARALHDEAEALQARYQARLGEWEHERQQARDKLAGEIEVERSRRLDALQAELEQEKQKAAAGEARRRADLQQQAELAALQQAAQFATRLLTQVAGPELEQKLVERVLDDLLALSEERAAALRNNWGETPAEIVVSSAYSLPEPQQQRLEQALRALTGVQVAARFEQQADLLAGVRITVGAWVLSGNLRDELNSLAEFAHGAPTD
jgi:F-type H+-transporting ATPase subunit b